MTSGLMPLGSDRANSSTTTCVLDSQRYSVPAPYYHEDPTDDANLGFQLDTRTLKFLI